MVKSSGPTLAPNWPTLGSHVTVCPRAVAPPVAGGNADSVIGSDDVGGAVVSGIGAVVSGVGAALVKMTMLNTKIVSVWILVQSKI